MDNTLMTIIGLFLVATLMFIVPLMAITERNDDISQSVIQTAVTEFTDKISNSGKISQMDYETLQNQINATGNKFDIAIEVQHLDENPGKKSVSTSGSLIGENVRYSTFTTEVVEAMYKNGSYPLNKGDNVIVTVKNTNRTLAQQLRSFMSKVAGRGTYELSASSSSMVVNTGM